MKNILKIVVLVILAIGFAAIVAHAQVQWPKEISINNGGKIVIYQPQPEDLRGNILSARAAVSIVAATGEEPTFGAIFFDAKFQTDKEKRKAVAYFHIIVVLFWNFFMLTTWFFKISIISNEDADNKKR